MKKMFMVFLMFLSIALVGNAFACKGPKCGPRSADVNLQFQATSDDSDQSSTGWRGNYNDKAGSYAEGYAGGTLDVHANADGYTRFLFWKIDNPAIAFPSYGTATDESRAWSWAKDYGLTSKAGAGAKTEGSAFTLGTAIGVKGCSEFVDSTVYVGGNVYQFNTAGETGRSGANAQGGNESGGNFYAQDRDYVSGNGFAFDTNEIEGGMITKGETYVTVDPYGNNRSAYAHTENMVEVNSPKLQFSEVGGNGGVNAMAQKGGSFAGGAANFSYNGDTYGNGQATIDAKVSVGRTQTTVTVTGSAFAVSNGSCKGCGQ